jgi:hypothetical protein
MKNIRVNKFELMMTQFSSVNTAHCSIMTSPGNNNKKEEDDMFENSSDEDNNEDY